MPSLSNFADAFTQAAQTIHQSRTLDETLHTIVEVACHSVSDFDHVGIATLDRRGKTQTRAFSGDLVPHLDEVQYTLKEGPCSAVLQGDDPLAMSVLRHEQRWPRYVPRALDAGVRSQMAVKLYLTNGTLGGLNLYSTVSEEVSSEAQALARLLAAHAAIALGHSHERETLNEGLQTRKVIGQAIGILMERYQIDEDRAFAFLVRASSHGNIKLRRVAQELVERRNAGSAAGQPHTGKAAVERRNAAAERRSSALLRDQAALAREAAEQARVRAEAVRAAGANKADSSRSHFEEALTRLEALRSDIGLPRPGAGGSDGRTPPRDG